MLNRIKQMFDILDRPEPAAGSDFSDKEVAAAALLVEAAQLDGGFGAPEQAAVKRNLIRFFHLTDAEADLLLAEAEQAQDASNHLLRFTRVIKDGWEPAERVAIIEMLWEVVYADGVLHAYEDNLMRHIGGLIYVTDQERGEARKRVLARLGL